MDRAKRIAKTLFLVVVRLIEVAIRAYVFLIHPIIFLLISLLLAVFKAPNSNSTYEDRVCDWCNLLIVDLIDWYEGIRERLEEKLNNTTIE